jgi:hypothetical protein
MGKILDEGYSGKAGSVVYYIMDGKRYFRSKPAKKKKRRGKTRVASRSNFGKASRCVNALVLNLKHNFLFHFNSTPYNRARGWLAAQFARFPEVPPLHQSFQLNSQVQLNAHSDLRELLRVQPILSHNLEASRPKLGAAGHVKIEFPSFDPLLMMQAPSGTSRIFLKAVVATGNMKDELSPTIRKIGEVSVTIDYKPGVQVIQPLVLDMDHCGETAMLVLALEYEVYGEVMKDPKWLPAGAVAFGKL